MTYLGLSGAKQISRELTAGEISDVLTSSVLHDFSIDYEDVAG
jgi:hypothetical protein